MKRILITVMVGVAIGTLFSACAAREENASASPVPAATAATESSANDEQEIRKLNLEYDTAAAKGLNPVTVIDGKRF